MKLVVWDVLAIAGPSVAYSGGDAGCDIVVVGAFGEEVRKGERAFHFGVATAVRLTNCCGNCYDSDSDEDVRVISSPGLMSS